MSYGAYGTDDIPEGANPDFMLHMDELRSAGNKAIFLWTLEGTNSGPGGSGPKRPFDMAAIPPVPIC